ncbi:hypothetical protein CDD82_222 [Ophiocordyceps australis]|uniref:Patatin-like phospholipase domain-containing protein n=1 Tax=Ophiocordyceps australis TaxID=1399860 RepID=A0A2C5YPM5_9HYPO|nr:hypothetical protein CDD82_222 [Ophiocordyceps australis]
MANLLVTSTSSTSSYTKKSPPKNPRHRTLSVGNVAHVLSRAYTFADNLILCLQDGLSAEQRERLQAQQEKRQLLCNEMKTAQSLKQWQAAAQELDALEGNDKWKQDSDSGDYNPRLIEQRLEALNEARDSRGVRAMMHLIRTQLCRDLGGMGNVDLYTHSYTGTKKLIERYVDSALSAIDAVVVQSATQADIDARDLLEGMLLARQSFGRSALLLSGGGTFGMTHIGVLKALFEARLLPRIISGASAGSIISAVLCTRTDDEIPALLAQFPYGDLAVFEAQDSRVGLLDHVRRLLTEGSWSDISNLARVMRGLTGDLTFQEAYNRTRRILNICVSTASLYELPRLLNYVTAPNVMIWSAVAASCSVPLVFNSSPLLVKDPVSGAHRPWNPTLQHFIDGSVDNDLPMTRLAEMFNVNHFIVSQVNPHVVPFLSKDDHLPPDASRPPSGSKRRYSGFDWSRAITSLARDEALHRLQFMADLGIFPYLMTKCRSVLSQRYSGDITIVPEVAMHNLPRLMSNPTSEFMVKSTVLGERATWPKLSRIRDRCAIELALDRAVHQLRARVVFSEGLHDRVKLNVVGAGGMRGKGQHISLVVPRLVSSSDASRIYGHRRQRRRSGGSVQTPLTEARLGYAAGSIEADIIAGQQQGTSILRHGRGGTTFWPATAGRKPRLRAAKSHVHVWQQHRSMMPTACHERLFLRGGQGTTWQMAKAANATGAVSTDDVETSEPGHSSDADAEQVTDESDTDLEDVFMKKRCDEVEERCDEAPEGKM